MRTILTLILLTALAGCSTIIDKTASAIPGCSSSDIQVKSFVPGVMSDTSARDVSRKGVHLCLQRGQGLQLH